MEILENKGEPTSDKNLEETKGTNTPHHSKPAKSKGENIPCHWYSYNDKGETFIENLTKIKETTPPIQNH